jgi:DNA-binding PadR family transcriptional regulator
MSEDLSDIFGAPAASVLRGLLPPRPAANGQPSVTGSAEQRKTTGSAGGPVDEADSDDVVVDQDANGDLDEDQDQAAVEDQDAVEGTEDDLDKDAMGDNVADDVGGGDDDARTVDNARAGEDNLVGDTEGRAEGRNTDGRHERRRRPTTVRRPVAPPAPRTTPRATTLYGRTPAPRTEPRRHSGTPSRATRTAAGGGRVTRIAARGHIDLLILLALRQGPGDGRDVIARLRADSDGVLQLPEQTVYRTLHRLTRNRLVLRRRDPLGRRARYVLSETGERVWRARLGQWQAFVRTVDAIARAGDEK